MEGLTEGRIVHYVLTNADVASIGNARAASGKLNRGNSAALGDHVPMIIVKVWSNEFGKDNPGVNGQCFLDGNDQLWVTSAKFDASGEDGTWHWIEKA